MSKTEQSNTDELPEDYDVAKYGEVNTRYIKATKTMKEAANRWVSTCNWRSEMHMDDLLFQKQPAFDFVKKYYPHYIHRRAKNGMYCYYERPGLANFPELLSSSQFTSADILQHYCFVTEYLWRILEPDNDAKMISIWDVTGVKMSDLSGGPFAQRTRNILKSTLATMQTHYPERSGALFIVNAPSWFTSLWRLISPHIDQKTKKKIKILGKNFHDELFEMVSPECVPKEFGGTDPLPLGQSPEEIALHAYVVKLAESAAPSRESFLALPNVSSDGSLDAGAGRRADENEFDWRIETNGDSDESAPSIEVNGDSNESAPSSEINGGRNESAPSWEINGGRNKSALSSEMNGDRNESAPSSEMNGDRNGSAPSSEMNGDRNESAPSSEMNEDRNESAPSIEMNGDSNESAPSIEMNEDNNESAPSSEMNGDSNESAPSSEMNVDSNESAPSSEMNGDSNESAPSIEVNGDSNESAPSSAMNEDSNESAPSSEMNEDRNESSLSVEMNGDRNESTPSITVNGDSNESAPSSEMNEDRNESAPSSEMNGDSN